MDESERYSQEQTPERIQPEEESEGRGEEPDQIIQPNEEGLEPIEGQEQPNMETEVIDVSGSASGSNSNEPPVYSATEANEPQPIEADAPDYDIAGEGGTQPYSSQLSGQPRTQVEESTYQQAEYTSHMQEQWGDSQVEFNSYGDPPVYSQYQQGEVDFVGYNEEPAQIGQQNVQPTAQQNEHGQRVEGQPAIQQHESEEVQQPQEQPPIQPSLEAEPEQINQPVVDYPAQAQENHEQIPAQQQAHPESSSALVPEGPIHESQPEPQSNPVEQQPQPASSPPARVQQHVIVASVQQQPEQQKPKPKKIKKKKKTDKATVKKSEAADKPQETVEQPVKKQESQPKSMAMDLARNQSNTAVVRAPSEGSDYGDQRIRQQQQQPLASQAINASEISRNTQSEQNRDSQGQNAPSTQPVAVSSIREQNVRESQPQPLAKVQPEEAPRTQEPVAEPEAPPVQPVAVVPVVATPPPEELPPPLTSLIILHQAQKQRIESTYKLFLRYNSNHQITTTRYKNILNVVCSELAKKKAFKNTLRKAIVDYMQGCSRACNQFSMRCGMMHPPTITNAKNKHANIGLEFRSGVQGLFNTRKVISNEYGRIGVFITASVIPTINRHFEQYAGAITVEEAKLFQKRQEYWYKHQQYMKLLKKLDKQFRRGTQGKKHDDLLAELCKMVNEQIVQRRGLILVGDALISLRKTHVRCERELFSQLQLTMNQLKTQSTAAYRQFAQRFELVMDLIGEVKDSLRFEKLALLTDIDYIKYVLELHYKTSADEFKNKHFQQFLKMVYFDTVVGDIRILYKGPTVKTFPLANPRQSLVHTSSGNLVLFASERDECRDKFVFKNLSTRLTGKGGIDFEEVLPGVIFDDKRTVRLGLLDDDRAQELVCYLNEKESEIIVDRDK